MVKLEVPKIEIEDEFSTNCSVVIEKSHDGRRAVLEYMIINDKVPNNITISLKENKDLM